MSELPIIIVRDPEEFSNAILNRNNENIYIYMDSNMSIIDERVLYPEIRHCFNKYSPSIIYADVVIDFGNYKNLQYYTDLDNANDKKAVISPIISKAFPIKLIPNPSLKYNSLNFLRQIQKHVIPWHLPKNRFTINTTEDDFQQLMKESQWVLQQEI